MNEPSYTEAFAELQDIIALLGQGAVSLDELSEKVRRAATLIRICRTKLTETEGDVDLILKELESAAQPDKPGAATS